MTIQEKHLSPPMPYSKGTLITTSSISFELIQTNNKFQVSVCVCSPAFFLLLYKIDIMRKQVLTLRLNQPRKILSSFHIREMGVFLIIRSFAVFTSLGFLQNFYLFFGDNHLHIGSRRAYPLPQSRFNGAPYIYIGSAPLNFLG